MTSLLSPNRFLKMLFSNVCTRGSLTVHTATGETMTFGDGTGNPVVVRFKDVKAQWEFLLDTDMRLGEIYQDARFIVEKGNIFDFLTLLLREAKGVRPPLPIRVMDFLRYHLRKIMVNTSKAKTKHNAAYHYDLDGHIYDWMLDADKQYTCAYYEQPNMTLEEAQIAKKRHVTAKLMVEPGMSVLEMGCGWGGFAMYLADVAQAGKVVAVNLSEEQVAIARKRAADAGLSDKVEFQIKDYRDSDGLYDRVASVGMLEHVGPSHYSSFFQTVKRTLKPDGVAFCHTIGCNDGVNFPNPWLNKYIFPSGYLPSLSELTTAIENAGLQVMDAEIWRLHYVPTLREWRDRFMAHREEAAKIYDERFCRMWEYYLAMGEAAFLFEDVVVFQITLGHSVDAVPITRGYIEERKVGLRAREAVGQVPFGRVEPKEGLDRMTAPAKAEAWK